MAVAIAASLVVFAAAPALGKKHHGARGKSFGVMLGLTYGDSTGDFTATASSPKQICAVMRPLTLWNYPYGGGSPTQVGSAVTDSTGTAIFTPKPQQPFAAGRYAIRAGKEKLRMTGKTIVCTAAVFGPNQYSQSG